MSANDKIEYKYLDMDNEVLYDNHDEYKAALRNRKGKALERCIPSQEYNQVLYAAGVKTNAFGEPFSVTNAVIVCRRLSGVTGS